MSGRRAGFALAANLLNICHVNGNIFAAVDELFSPRQIVELLLLIAVAKQAVLRPMGV